MYIGRLAKLSGATPKAIRLYESLGLIPTPIRQGTYRVYSHKDVVLVHMIRRGRAVGFSLDEMKSLIHTKARTDNFPLAIANDLIAQKRQRVRADMDKLRELDRQLVELHEEINRTFG